MSSKTSLKLVGATEFVPIKFDNLHFMKHCQVNLIYEKRKKKERKTERKKEKRRMKETP
jgi:hypothetical protein